MPTRYLENAGQMEMPQAFTYDDAEQMYGVAHHNYKRGMAGRGDAIPLGGNTTVRRDGKDIVVRLHNTDIIRWHPDDSITLNSGGYRTNTTKGRINAFLGPRFNVFSKRGEWWIDLPAAGGTEAGYVKFVDGMRTYPDGRTSFPIRHNPPERHLVGYLATDKEGTELTDYSGRGLGWRVDAVVSNWRRADGDRVKALKLRKGSGRNTVWAGGLWLNDAGTLFRGEVFGKLGASFMTSAKDASDMTLAEAEKWDRIDAEDTERGEEETEE